MAAASAAWSVPPPARVATTWIIDRKADLLWLLGSVSVSYAFIAAHVLLAIPAVLLWWVWIVALDGPHIFATLSRTYLDPEERETRGRLLAWSLLWFLAGPAAFALSLLAGTPAPFGLFLAFANVWAYWHVVRQHYGFMVLYKRKNADTSFLDDRLDSALLYVGLLAPFVGFALTHAEARRVLGFSGTPTWERAVATACWMAVALVVLAALVRQLGRSRQGLPVNAPKILFWLAALPLSWVAFSPWVVARADLVAFAVFITAFHNIQYQALVWFYHRNRYHAPGGQPQAFGLAEVVSRRFWIFASVGVLFTLAYRLAGCAFAAMPGCGGFSLADPLAAGLTPTHLAVGFFWGFALHHYYLDQKIWRLRKDRALTRDLRLPAP